MKKEIIKMKNVKRIRKEIPPPHAIINTKKIRGNNFGKITVLNKCTLFCSI